MKTLVVLLSHAQSTAHTYFTGAVKSDVVPPIMVCWACLLQSFGAETIGHIRWPVKSDDVHLIMVCWAQQTIGSCRVLFGLMYCAFIQLVMVHWCGGFGAERFCVVLLTVQ